MNFVFSDIKRKISKFAFKNPSPIVINNVTNVEEMQLCVVTLKQL